LASSEISIPTIEGSYSLKLGTGGSAPWYFVNSPVGAQGRATCVRYEYDVPYTSVSYTHYPINFRDDRGPVYYAPYETTGSDGMRIGFHMELDGTFVSAWEYRSVKTDPQTPGGQGKYSLTFGGQVYIPPGQVNLCGSSASIEFAMNCYREGDRVRPNAYFGLSIS
jgi:hypothetical protein